MRTGWRTSVTPHAGARRGSSRPDRNASRARPTRPTSHSCYSSSAPTARPPAALQAEWLAALRARLRRGTSGQDVLRRALSLLRPYWRRQLELLLHMVLDLSFALVIPLSTKYLFDDIIAVRAFDRLAIWITVLLVVFTVS